jgi:hypothetical protein
MKSREIWKLEHNRILFYLKFSITLLSLESFGALELPFLHFTIWKQFRYLENLRK